MRQGPIVDYLESFFTSNFNIPEKLFSRVLDKSYPNLTLKEALNISNPTKTNKIQEDTPIKITYIDPDTAIVKTIDAVQLEDGTFVNEDTGEIIECRNLMT